MPNYRQYPWKRTESPQEVRRLCSMARRSHLIDYFKQESAEPERVTGWMWGSRSSSSERCPAQCHVQARRSISGLAETTWICCATAV